jgi:hypothetical protein
LFETTNANQSLRNAFSSGSNQHNPQFDQFKLGKFDLKAARPEKRLFFQFKAEQSSNRPGKLGQETILPLKG